MPENMLSPLPAVDAKGESLADYAAGTKLGRQQRSQQGQGQAVETMIKRGTKSSMHVPVEIKGSACHGQLLEHRRRRVPAAGPGPVDRSGPDHDGAEGQGSGRGQIAAGSRRPSYRCSIGRGGHQAASAFSFFGAMRRASCIPVETQEHCDMRSAEAPQLSPTNSHHRGSPMRCNPRTCIRGWRYLAVLMVAVAGAGLSGVRAEETSPKADAALTPHPSMLRYPDVSRDRIVFLYANDLWLVPREGGTALPLSGPAGQELHPKFSGDGKTIAFVANYDGNQDLYTIPIEGGSPTRVTHHPAGEALCDWTAEGRLLFSTNGLSGLMRQTELYEVDAKGGLPRKLPVPYRRTERSAAMAARWPTRPTPPIPALGSATGAAWRRTFGCSISRIIRRSGSRSGKAPTRCRCGTARRCITSPTPARAIG